jgi:hypothetical protein
LSFSFDFSLVFFWWWCVSFTFLDSLFNYCFFGKGCDVSFGALDEADIESEVVVVVREEEVTEVFEGGFTVNSEYYFIFKWSLVGFTN